MTKKQNPAVASQTGRGDRIIQVILLVLIAAGIIGIPLVLRGGNSGGAAMGPGAGPGAGPGGPGGFPGGGAPGDEGEARTAVRVQDAVLGDIREYIRVNGDVDAASSVGIYPDTSGKLTDLTVAPGDSVRRGQVIGMVDASLSGQVYKPNAVAATINGTVTAVNSDIGETVNTATEIVTIGNLSSLKVITYIPERYVGAVRVGMEAEVVLDAYPDAVFPARVTEMSPVLDTPSRSQKTSLSFLASDPRIRVGMFATTRIIVREETDVVTVPHTALTTNYDQDVVYTVTDGTAEMREVRVGLKSAESVQILDGLSEGETVVVQGLSGITDGAPVRIVE